jgi:hypothetical protein
MLRMRCSSPHMRSQRNGTYHSTSLDGSKLLTEPRWFAVSAIQFLCASRVRDNRKEPRDQNSQFSNPRGTPARLKLEARSYKAILYATIWTNTPQNISSQDPQMWPNPAPTQASYGRASTPCAAGHGPFPPPTFPLRGLMLDVRACGGKVVVNVGKMEGCRLEAGVY